MLWLVDDATNALRFLTTRCNGLDADTPLIVCGYRITLVAVTDRCEAGRSWNGRGEILRDVGCRYGRASRQGSSRDYRGRWS